MHEQEFLVAKVIDAFIARIKDLGQEPQGIDLSIWFNLLTFDIIGELAFGQSFEGVSSGRSFLLRVDGYLH